MLAALLVSSFFLQTVTPTPVEAPAAPTADQPTPPPPAGAGAAPTSEGPRLIAAFTSEQDLGSERTALFDDGTVAHVVTFRQRSTISRAKITTNERDLVKVVCGEVLELLDESLRQPVLPEGSRRFRLEVVDAKGATRTWRFGELTPLPLPLGRARGALDDLRARFIKREVPEDRKWDPASVVLDQKLRRRSDGKWFLVVRDDTFERNLEVREAGNGLERLFLVRDELPRLFENPADLTARSEEP